jgi:hypothetical protein
MVKNKVCRKRSSVRNLYSLYHHRLQPIGVWQGVAMDSPKYHYGPPCPTLLCPAGEPSLTQPYGCFRGGRLVGWATCGYLSPSWTPHAIRLCLQRLYSITHNCSHYSCFYLLITFAMFFFVFLFFLFV